MSITSITSTITKLNKTIADLEMKRSDEKKRESTYQNKIIQTQRSITTYTSKSSLKSKMNQINQHTSYIAKSIAKQADLSKKIANKIAERNKYEQQLLKAQEQDRKKLNEIQKKRQLDYQKKLTQELKEQRQFIQSPPSSSSTLQEVNDYMEPTYDVFISHASEDKEDFVRPLAEELLRIGVKVWYDEFSIKWGDSLRVSIDKGLANSKFGVIVISPSFIKKKWPEYEVNGLIAREIVGENKILPIWHRITKSEVIKYSPSLADKAAMNSSIDEISYIASELKSMLPQN